MEQTKRKGERGNASPKPFNRLSHATVHAGRDAISNHPPTTLGAILHLQDIGQGLVHLGDLGGDAEVDGTVTDLDDEATNHIRVDL